MWARRSVGDRMVIPRLSVVIVSYQVRDLLRTCLQSVQISAARTAGTLRVDIIVVDNASADGSAEMVRREFPDVALLAQSENLGFTGGNNLALRTLGFAVDDLPSAATPAGEPAARPDYVLLLNPDTEVVDDALGQMVSCLEHVPNAGACGARLSYGDGGFQHGAFAFPTLAQILIDFYPLTGMPGMHRLHDSRLNGRYPVSLWHGAEPFPVDFVLGAAMMVRGDVIEQVGGLDDRFFMYCEEMDWSMRIQEAGWCVYAVPAAHVLHHEAQSSRQARWDAFVRLWRSRFLFFAKHGDRYSQGYLTTVRAVVASALRIKSRQARRRFRAGEIDGVTLAAELDAYKTVMTL